MSSDLRWPTAAELDANPALWDRWWWVNGAPERLGVDRMTYPARVTWRARFVDELPVEWFGGMVASASEVEALKAPVNRRDWIKRLAAQIAEEDPSSKIALILKLQARIVELEAHIDNGRRPHCHHIGFGEHAPFHGTHTIGHGLPDDETYLSPEEAEIDRLQARVADLVDRLAAVAKERDDLLTKIDANTDAQKCAEVRAERDRMYEAIEPMRRFGESSDSAIARIVDELLTAKRIAGGALGEEPVAAVRRLVADHDIHKERASALQRQLAELKP